MIVFNGQRLIRIIIIGGWTTLNSSNR